ncbi:hypothetical protein [Kineococcus sp. SYSU DK002]|uniref:hypothetical protein n=1 Tax=Kineococcus sp. SYSU DK002 TaxID=3383123 RepID=UPI003D7DC707
MSRHEGRERRERRDVADEDCARAAELLADYGRLVGPAGGQMPPVVRDTVNAAVAEDRAAELILAMAQIIDGTWPGVLARDDVQATLRLTAISCREQLGPNLDTPAG